MNVRFGAFFREVMLSVTARPLWTTLVSLATVVLIGAPALLQAFERDVLNQARVRDLERGANVLSLTSGKGSLSGTQCDALSQWDGVREVGHASNPQTVNIESAPADPVQSVQISQGYARILSARNDLSGSVFLGESASAEFGINAGSTISVVGTSAVIVDAVVNVANRAPEQSRWLYRVDATAELVRQCLVEVEPEAMDTFRGAVRSGFTPSSEIDVEVLVAADLPRELERWSSRPTEHLWLLGGLTAAIAPVLMTLVRRGEYSIYVLAGWTRLEATLVLGATNWVLGLIGASGAIACVCIGVVLFDSDAWQDLALVGLTNAVAAIAVQHTLICLAHTIVVARGLSSATRARP